MLYLLQSWHVFLLVLKPMRVFYILECPDGYPVDSLKKLKHVLKTTCPNILYSPPLMSVLYPSAALPYHLFVQGPDLLAHHPKAFELFDASTQSLPWLILLTSGKCLFIHQVQSLTQTHHHPLSWFSFLLLCCYDRTLIRNNLGRKGFLWFTGYSSLPWGNQGRN